MEFKRVQVETADIAEEQSGYLYILNIAHV